MTVTESQLYGALGLTDPGWFEHNVGQLQGSGRTTRMLVEALYRLSQGNPVKLYGHSYEHGRELQRTLERYAFQVSLRVLPGYIDSGYGSKFLLEDDPYLPPRWIFIDHTVFEQAQNRLRHMRRINGQKAQRK